MNLRATKILLSFFLDFIPKLASLVVKNLPTYAGDTGSIPGSGRSPGERKSNPLQYSCLENLMERGAWWATVYRVAESDMTEAT